VAPDLERIGASLMPVPGLAKPVNTSVSHGIQFGHDALGAPTIESTVQVKSVYGGVQQAAALIKNLFARANEYAGLGQTRGVARQIGGPPPQPMPPRTPVWQPIAPMSPWVSAPPSPFPGGFPPPSPKWPPASPGGTSLLPSFYGWNVPPSPLPAYHAAPSTPSRDVMLKVLGAGPVGKAQW